MIVKMRYLGWIVDLTRKDSEEIIIDNGSTVGDLLKLLANKYGPELINRLVTTSGQLQPYVFFVVNGKRIEDTYLRLAEVKSGSQTKEVSIMVIPALSGGSDIFYIK